MNGNTITMSREAVKKWAESGKQFSMFLEERFNAAIMRDMMTTDEEGMFFLFCFEQGMDGFNDAMLLVLFEELMTELNNIMGL